MAVEVVVQRETIEKWGNTVHTANYVMTKLKEGGAPVEGGLFPISVQWGKVVIEEDPFGNLVVTWSE